MRNPTIWESASRPLFVRSVWLETASNGRSLQRHFILDYEPRLVKQRQYKSARNSSRRTETEEKGKLQHSQSCDFVNWADPETPITSPELSNYFLIGSAKVNLQPTSAQQQQQQRTQNSKSQKRSLCLGRHRTHRFDQGRCLNELYDLYSRRSSLQDLQSTLSAANSQPDERLAERVLNWLDLAGKQDTLQAPKSGSEMAPEKKKATKANNNTRTDCKLQRANTAQPPQKRSSKHPPKNSSAPKQTRPKKGDSVKHITIIFNREGVPVRFNRPARNMDLCALSNSPRTARRMAGPLASARLYEAADKSEISEKPLRDSPHAVHFPSSRVKWQDHKPESGAQKLQKCGHEECGSSSKRGYYDAKKQLHIFMPSLPKKGLLASSGGGSVDDTVSALSNNLSEFCRF